MSESSTGDVWGDMLTPKVPECISKGCAEPVAVEGASPTSDGRLEPVAFCVEHAEGYFRFVEWLIGIPEVPEPVR